MKRSIGLALGSGGAKGLGTLGVLRALEEQRSGLLHLRASIGHSLAPSICAGELE